MSTSNSNSQQKNGGKENPVQETEDPYSTSLYVADLPKETTIEDLQKIFQSYHFLTASLNNIKNNQTWAQVYFETKEWATKARHELNGFILKPMNGANSIKEGKPIRICKYEGKVHNKQNNIKQSLLVKNISDKMTQSEFYKLFLKYGDIVSAKIEYDENGISKGFGYIYYYKEDSAEDAKKNLNGNIFYNKSLEIVNLIPGKKNKTNTITLFVLNIPFNTTEKELTPIFEQFGPISNISVNQKGFAYVSYNNFESATKCLKKMKEEPFSFPGMPSIVVKFACSKEERNANKNFLKNNGGYINNTNLNVQFNCMFVNQNIKNEFDLDKEIRLFIKVVMLTDYIPKEVLVDFESMSGLVLFGTYKDYNYFFKKYKEYCENQNPYFQCIPYNLPIKNEEENKIKNYNQNINLNYNNNNYNNTPTPYGSYNNYQNQKQQEDNDNNNMDNKQYNYNYNNRENDYNQNMNKNNYNKNYNNNNYENNNSKYNNNNNFRNNKRQNYNNNSNNYNYNNKKYNNQKINNNKNNTNNNNNTTKYIFRPGDNYDLSNMKMGVFGPNNGNPYIPKPLIQDLQINNNLDNNNNLNNINGINFNENKNDINIIDERNLQSLNPSQLHSQFNNKPPKVYSNMLSSQEREEIRIEIADTIYEIVSAKYPQEAAKITGMIFEKGIETMNMLLSKKEDLDEIVDRAYDMIVNNKK